ncbi:type 2 lanthipeptide synthetase LanM family protein [Lactobacillus sp. ESL0230]|uniref:type 2 lanthipeptide synthetase LanM family protein n=1 Tax=Lactobacillus sp. ESL0230 TaxID=2069353 RepID=UPI000EFD39C5|nr:type 2 lanthipeptide synthetase LanM family protein [Lactobacillus sp. ESL0230]RMC46731.1 type 2 lantipeptide synthetase LanM [Lactobacillus sp. ESL0230]
MLSSVKLLFPNIDKKLYQEILKYEDKEKITNITSYVSNFVKKKMNTSILEYIDHRISKVLIVEINIRRINNEFISKDSNEQYNEFVTDHNLLTNLSSKYPILMTEVRESVHNIINFYIEFLERLQKDYKKVYMYFGIKGEIQDILLGLGDPHRGHRTVLEIKFENKSIFYKPRNSYGDVAIKSISKWLQSYGIDSFDVPQCLVYKNYSWVQGINYLSTDKNKINSIYYQFGTLAAISYIFNLSDLHMENVITSNGHLYLVDAETILQDSFITSSEEETAKDIIYKDMRQSVLMTNLFPALLFSDKNTPDISGITGHGGQLFKHKLSKIENLFTSKILLRKIDYINSDEKNIPYIDDIHKKINPKNYTQDIVDGFKDAFSTILKNKKKFLMDHDIWDNFNKGVYRIIFKNTSAYSAILNTINSPKYSQSEINVNHLLNLLKSGNNNNTSIYNIFSSEVADIRNGDIPYFYKKSNGLVVYNSNNKKIYSSTVFNGIDAYKTKICRFSSKDIEKQIALIKIAMATPIKNWDLGKKDRYTVDKLRVISYNNKLINDQISAILERIISNGIRYKNTINWKNIKISENNNWIIGPSDFSLYDGITGIGITFAVAYSLTDNNKYLDVLNKCLKEIDSLEKQIDEDFKNYSMFNGIGSLIYFYFYLYSLLHEEKYFKKGIFYLKSLQKNIDSITNLDFIDGASGVLAVLCELENNFPDLDLNKSINSIIDKIVENWDNKEAWKSDIDPDHHLNGMSHGISGIIYALYKARNFSKNPNLDLMIEKAIQIENNGIEDKNWIDLRSRANRIEKGFPDPVHWCHGAPGIGLSRIILNKVFDTKQDTELAKLGTLEKGIGGSDCLCHGSLGNLDLFVLDYLTNNNLQSLDIARKIATDLCSKKDWVSGIPQKITVFGMMTGLSGMAYELMRILYPKKVPSILLLELNKV